MSFTTDFRAWWISTFATIPGSWSQDTNFSDKYIQGGEDGFTAPANGGASIHNHTMPNHTHGGSSHSHKFSSDALSMEFVYNVPITGKPTKYLGAVDSPHSHRAAFSSAATLTYQSGGSNVLNTTGGAAEAKRPILIGPDDGNQDLPDDVVCYSSSTLLSGFTAVSSMDGYFSFAVGTGSDASMASVSGSADHNHTASSSHTHAVPAHGHGTDTSGFGTNQEVLAGGSVKNYLTSGTHYHRVTSSLDANGTSGAATPTSDTVSNNPAYVKLLAIQNTSGADIDAETTGLVMMYVGSEASIPSGWELATETTDKQVMGTDTVGEIGDTGGANSHTHTMDHTHTSTGAHTHTGSEASDVGSTQTIGNGSGTVFNSANHTHANWNYLGTNPGVSDSGSGHTTDSGDPRWHYRTLIYVRKISEVTRRVMVVS